MRAWLLATLCGGLVLGTPGCDDFSVERYCQAHPETCEMRVAALSPARAQVAGGVTVVVTGSGFDPDLQVEVGGRPAHVVSFEPFKFTFALPPGEPGAADVVLRGGGRELRLPGAFVYEQHLPEIRSLEPRVASHLGGSRLTLRVLNFPRSGTVLVGGKRAYLESYPAQVVTAKDALGVEVVVTVLTPPGPLGAHDVEVRTSEGTARLEDAVTYRVPWEARGQGLEGTVVRALLADPDAPSGLWAGTLGGGLFRSMDGGDSWARVDALEEDLSVGALLRASNGDLLVGTLGAVLRTRDWGQSWERLSQGLPTDGKRPLEVQGLTESEGRIYACNARGVARLDLGTNFWTSEGGPPSLDSAADAQWGCAVAATPHGPYLARRDGVWTPGPYPQWKRLGSQVEVRALRAMPTGSGDVVWAAGSGGLHRYDASRSQWSPLLTHQDVYTLLPQEDGQLWLGTGSGLLRPGPEGEWTATQAPAVPVRVLIRTAEGTLVLGTHEEGVLVGDGQGAFTPANGGLDAVVVRGLVVDPFTPQRLWALTPRGLFRSDDAGGGWTRLTLPAHESFLQVRTSPLEPGRLYLSGTRGLLRSDDGGESWQRVGPERAWQDVAVSPLLPSTLYAATDAGLWRSSDGGETWTSLEQERADAPAGPHGLAASTTRADRVFSISPSSSRLRQWEAGAWTDSSVPAGYAQVLQAPDSEVLALLDARRVALFGPGDASRAPFFTVPTEVSGWDLRTLAFVPGTPARLLLGTQGGLLRFDYALDPKTGRVQVSGLLDVSPGLVHRDVRALALDPTTPSVLYVGTAGGGVWRSTLGGL